MQPAVKEIFSAEGGAAQGQRTWTEVEGSLVAAVLGTIRGEFAWALPENPEP